jgi:hydrogenase nickel incorporation protein HypA/HybF
MDEHELASQVLAAVDDAAYRNSATRIAAVHLAVGGRRVFDLGRLQAAFRQAARGTVAEGAELMVRILPVQHHCQSCGHNFEAAARDYPCPECGHPHTEMVGGEELQLVEMKLADVA